MKSLLALALFVGALLPLEAAAQETHRVELVGEVEPELLVRLRGQLAGLDDWLLVQGDAVPEVAEIGTRDADALVWFRTEGEVVSVWVADPRRGRLYVEQLARGEDASARYEAIAIVVRTSLEALAMGGVIGIALPPPTEAIEPAPSAPAVEPEPIVEVPSRVRIQATLAFAGGFDGLAIPHGAELGLGIGFDWLMIAITGRIGLPSVVEGERVSLSLEHHRIAVRGSFALLDEVLLRITVALDLGASLVTRTTIAVAPGLTPTASALSASASVGASARLIVWLVPSLGLTLDLGAELNTPTPRYQVDDTVTAEPWPVLLRGLGGLVVEAPFL